MCGRFTQHYTWSELHALYGLVGAPQNLEPRYNITPTTTVDTVVAGKVGRELARMRWWMIPSWWKKTAKEVPATFNARIESVVDKPMFRSSFKRTRCLIPASGFYEWQKTPDGKQPYAIVPKGGPILTFAGLWDTWKDAAGGEVIRSCSIITGEPNEVMAPIHNRMPAILEPSAWGKWLGEDPAEPDELLALLNPCPATRMRAYPVSTRVNSAKNNDCGIVEPLKAGAGVTA